MSQTNTNLSVEEALTILKEYSCLQIKIVDFEADKHKLRQAIKIVSDLCVTENIGICADSFQEGFKTLKSYLKALGISEKLEPSLTAPRQTPIYIKFNTETMSYYVDYYTGSYRGVLLSCQSDNHNLVGIYGHFPLNLFE
ncbi:DUF1824 family protein [Crocosphaera chwakensis]|uniref:DUF1824 domain-containing protein n=1 Tax=Crocosphaera chwakensis CCY0110 TaxID=391612 RepID=A3IVB7_9CHRO|nr:DUF1824 family protein [Crocosphaera chwakensis]EAZ89586.1 hypothetical protein CY0110_08466 [Crocosphaera chwakensis CCY0110]